MTSDTRFARHLQLFGREGQERIRASSVAIVGIGGLGTHVVQQLAFLGVGRLILIDSEELDETNLNRYVSARWDDPIPGTWKVDIGKRMVESVDPEIAVETVRDTLVSDEAYEAIKTADCTFGCLDCQGARLVLNELCAAYEKPYIDLASEVVPGDPPEYGGRVCVSWSGSGCIDCFDELDRGEARERLAGPAGNDLHRAIYGVDREVLGGPGPSVVSINGVIASLGVTEFMVSITGLRKPHELRTYRGTMGKVTAPAPDSGLPRSDCYYCGFVRGRGAAADVERYIREGVGAYLR